MSIPPPTRRALAALLDEQPAWPANGPDNRWSAAELRNFINFHDAQIAAQVAQVPTAHTRKVKVVTR